MEPYEDEAEGWDDEPEEDNDLALESKMSSSAFSKQKNYKLWSADEIDGRQKKIIDEVKDLLGLSEDDSITALKHYSWNAEKLQEQWFDDEKKTREICGLTPKEGLVSRNMTEQNLCYICYGSLSKDE